MYEAVERARKGQLWGSLKRRNDSRERREIYQDEHVPLVDALAARELGCGRDDGDAPRPRRGEPPRQHPGGHHRLRTCRPASRRHRVRPAMRIIYTHTDEAPALATAVAAADPARLRGCRGNRARAARHLARRAPARAVPRSAGAGPPRRGRPRGARRARADAGGQHRQAAEHQRVGAAAEGGHRRAPGAGV